MLEESIHRLTDEKDIASLCADKCKVSFNYESFIFFFFPFHVLKKFKYLNKIASPDVLSKQQLDFLAGIQVINMNCVLHDTYRKITFKYVFTEAPFNVTHIFSERRNRSS